MSVEPKTYGPELTVTWFLREAIKASHGHLRTAQSALYAGGSTNERTAAYVIGRLLKRQPGITFGHVDRGALVGHDGSISIRVLRDGKHLEIGTIPIEAHRTFFKPEMISAYWREHALDERIFAFDADENRLGFYPPMTFQVMNAGTPHAYSRELSFAETTKGNVS